MYVLSITSEETFTLLSKTTYPMVFLLNCFLIVQFWFQVVRVSSLSLSTWPFHLPACRTICYINNYHNLKPLLYRSTRLERTRRDKATSSYILVKAKCLCHMKTIHIYTCFRMFLEYEMTLEYEPL